MAPALRDLKLVISVGRVVPNKGYERTIRALPTSMSLLIGLATLVSDAGALPELGVLPGCHVFRTEAQLAALLQDVAHGRLPQQPAEVMHAAVTERYGLVTVGTRLLEMMKVVTPCAS